MNDKLTKTSSNGDLQQVGFLPDYEGSYLAFFAGLFGAEAFNADGTKVTVAEGGHLQKALEWEKHKFYDKFGAAKLKKFKDGFGEYDSADHPWLSGKVAMIMEGEWMTSYPKRYGKGQPKDWNVAPMAVPDDMTSRYGYTAVSDGNMLVIPKGAKHVEEAWTLVRCMGTAFEQNAAMNDFVHNIDTTEGAAKFSESAKQPQVKAFNDLAAGPKAQSPHRGVVGSELIDALLKLEEEYLAGRIKDSDLGGRITTVVDKAQQSLDDELS